MTTFVEAYRPALMMLTLGILAWAFYLAYRPRPAASQGRAIILSLNKVMLWAATGVVVLSLLFPQMMTSLIATTDEFTVDMQRTVLVIEGMT